MKAKTFLFAFLTWLIPIGVSMLMYNSETNTYLPNIAVFKTVMLALLGGLTFFFFNILKNNETTNWVKIATIFTIVCVLLDIAILIPIFKISIGIWSMTILPFYFLSFYGFGFFLLKSKVRSQI